MKLARFNQLDPAYPASFSTLLDRFFQDSIGQNIKQFTPAVDIAEDEKHLADDLQRRLTHLWPELEIVAVVHYGVKAAAALAEILAGR